MPVTVTTPRQPLDVPARDATGLSQGPVRVRPPWRRDRVPQLVPGAVSRGATVTVAAAGVGLLLLAGGLRRRHRVAWLAAVGLLAGSAALHVVKGLDVEEALTEAFLAGLLAGQAGCFPARATLGEHRAVLGPALTVAAATLAYGTLGLVANDHDVRADLGLGGMVAEVGRMALGLGAGVELAGRFGRLFPGSLAAVFWVGALTVAARALAPALAGRTTDPGLAAAVATSGDSLAYFALRDDRAVVRAGDALVAYGTVGPVALAAGDPLGPPGQWPGAIAAFRAAAAGQGRVAGVLGCGDKAAAAWRTAGLTTIYLGDEAVLDLDRFTLEGPGGADRPPELEPGAPRRLHLAGVPLPRPRPRPGGHARRAVPALAGGGGRAGLLDDPGPPAGPARPGHAGGRGRRRCGVAVGIPPLRALGDRGGQPRCDAPRPARALVAERLPGSGGGQAATRAGRAPAVAELLVSSGGAGGGGDPRSTRAAAGGPVAVAAPVRPVPDRVAVPLQPQVRTRMAAPLLRHRDARGTPTGRAGYAAGRGTALPALAATPAAGREGIAPSPPIHPHPLGAAARRRGGFLVVSVRSSH